jgi:hypothetical protein
MSTSSRVRNAQTVLGKLHEFAQARYLGLNHATS